MKKSFEKELPNGYREVYSIDVADTKTGILMNVIAFFITAFICVTAVVAIRPPSFFENFSYIRTLVFIAALLMYIVLHELVHGVAYKLLTRQKLKFGITFTAAYCGVPDIYVYRRTALISLLAPFVVFDIILIAAMLLLNDKWDRLYAALLFGLHVGGCVGDLYDTLLFLTRFRDPRTLMRDPGPKQTFYLPEE